MQKLNILSEERVYANLKSKQKTDSTVVGDNKFEEL